MSDEQPERLAEYTDEAGNTFQLNDEDAKARGLKPAGKAVQADEVENKAVTADSKSAAKK